MMTVMMTIIIIIIIIIITIEIIICAFLYFDVTVACRTYNFEFYMYRINQQLLNNAVLMKLPFFKDF